MDAIKYITYGKSLKIFTPLLDFAKVSLAKDLKRPSESSNFKPFSWVYRVHTAFSSMSVNPIYFTESKKDDVRGSVCACRAHRLIFFSCFYLLIGWLIGCFCFAFPAKNSEGK